MKQTVHNILSRFSLLLIMAVVSLFANAQSGVMAPELVFRNPVLKSGTANSEGAIYRFSNVSGGVDAELKLLKFSRPDITMADVDLASLGWEKALQPQFGLPGVVAPFQNWFIDFELKFYKAGTTDRQKMKNLVFTALDVDGDGWSISEYAQFVNANTTTYSSVSLLGGSAQSIVFGSNGESITALSCVADNLLSVIQNCSKCNGTGTKDGTECDDCDGSGKVYKACKHPYQFIQDVEGPVQNFNNIDTAATQVMVTYSYLDKDKINFRYGGKSAANSSDGSGVRLNSLWAKEFSLAPLSTLPVNFSAFSVQYDKMNAIVNWQTAKEENLSHFVVQRSTDGKVYSDIATVFAGGTSNYSYKDKNVASATGIVYYRIISVDQTRETQASTVKMIRLTNNELRTLALTTYPNPVKDELRITLPNAWQGKAVVLQLFTANGTVANSTQLGSAGQTETLMLNGLAKGLYVVKAICGTETAQQRIVKN